MLPVIEPRTTSGSPSPTANRAMISSGALPKLALRKPPIPEPVCSAACSVASPISHASGTRASAETQKTVTSPAPTQSRKAASGASASPGSRILRAMRAPYRGVRAG
jgi:hypothetical protein